jgi:hypothetical protein
MSCPENAAATRRRREHGTKGDTPHPQGRARGRRIRHTSVQRTRRRRPHAGTGWPRRAGSTRHDAPPGAERQAPDRKAPSGTRRRGRQKADFDRPHHATSKPRPRRSASARHRRLAESPTNADRSGGERTEARGSKRPMHKPRRPPGPSVDAHRRARRRTTTANDRPVRSLDVARLTDPRQTSSEARQRERTPREAPASSGETGRSGRGSRQLRQAGLLKKAISRYREPTPAARPTHSACREGRPRRAGGSPRNGPPTSASVLTTTGNRGGDGPSRRLRGESSPREDAKPKGVSGGAATATSEHRNGLVGGSRP